MTDDTNPQINHYLWNALVNFISQNPAIIKIINFNEKEKKMYKIKLMKLPLLQTLILKRHIQ